MEHSESRGQSKARIFKNKKKKIESKVRKPEGSPDTEKQGYLNQMIKAGNMAVGYISLGVL